MASFDAPRALVSPPQAPSSEALESALAPLIAAFPVRLVHSDGPEGRYYVASEAIAAGQTVVVADPLALVLDDAFVGQRCSYCMEKRSPIIPCEGGCGQYSYCSKRCASLDARWHQPHHPDGECQFLKEVASGARGGTRGLRLLARIGRAVRAEPSEDTAALLALVPHLTRVVPAEWETQLSTSPFIESASLVKANAHRLQEFPTGKNLGTLLEFQPRPFHGVPPFVSLSLMRADSWRCTWDARLADRDGLAFGLFPAAVFINHSCEPNATFALRGRKLEIRACVPIACVPPACHRAYFVALEQLLFSLTDLSPPRSSRAALLHSPGLIHSPFLPCLFDGFGKDSAGQPITVNYVPTVAPSWVRHETLSSKFGFDCHCTLCRDHDRQMARDLALGGICCPHCRDGAILPLPDSRTPARLRQPTEPPPPYVPVPSVARPALCYRCGGAVWADAAYAFVQWVRCCVDKVAEFEQPQVLRLARSLIDMLQSPPLLPTSFLFLYACDILEPAFVLMTDRQTAVQYVRQSVAIAATFAPDWSPEVARRRYDCAEALLAYAQTETDRALRQQWLRDAVEESRLAMEGFSRAFGADHSSVRDCAQLQVRAERALALCLRRASQRAASEDDDDASGGAAGAADGGEAKVADPMSHGSLRGGGSVFALNSSVTTIGRDPSCDICLQSRSVSARHAAVEITPEGPVLRDLNSRNGTIVNDTRVQNATIPLVNGDVIRFGYEVTSFRYESPESESGQEPAPGSPSAKSPDVVYPHRTLRRTSERGPVVRGTHQSPSRVRPGAGDGAGAAAVAAGAVPPASFDAFVVPGAAPGGFSAVGGGGGGGAGMAGASAPGHSGPDAPYRAVPPGGSVHLERPGPPVQGAVFGYSGAGGVVSAEAAVRLEEQLRARAERQEVALARLDAEHRAQVQQELTELRRKLAVEEARGRRRSGSAEDSGTDDEALRALQQRVAELETEAAAWKESAAQRGATAVPVEREIQTDRTETADAAAAAATAADAEALQRAMAQAEAAEARAGAAEARAGAAEAQASSAAEAIVRQEQELNDLREALNRSTARASALEQYARQLQEHIVRLTKRIADQEDKIKELSSPDWVRTLQQNQALIESLQEQLVSKDAEVAAIQEALAQLTASARVSNVALAEDFHASYVRMAQALQSVRAQLDALARGQQQPVHRWSELMEENKRLQARLRAVEGAAAAATKKHNQLLAQREARIATMNAHLAHLAAGGGSQADAARFLVDQLRQQEAALAQERAEMQQREVEAAQLRAENELLRRQLTQIQESGGDEVSRLRDQLEELRTAAGGEEIIRLRDAVAALTAKSNKERSRSKQLYAELKRARAAAIDTDAAVETLSRLLQERDARIAALEAAAHDDARAAASAEQRAAAAEAQSRRAQAALHSLKQKQERVADAVRGWTAGVPSTQSAPPVFPASPAAAASPAAGGGGAGAGAARARWDRPTSIPMRVSPRPFVPPAQGVPPAAAAAAAAPMGAFAGPRAARATTPASTASMGTDMAAAFPDVFADDLSLGGSELG